MRPVLATTPQAQAGTSHVAGNQINDAPRAHPSNDQRSVGDCRSTNSWRGIMSVVEFAAAYSLGKPIACIEQSSGGLASVLAELGIDEDYTDGA